MVAGLGDDQRIGVTVAEIVVTCLLSKLIQVNSGVRSDHTGQAHQPADLWELGLVLIHVKVLLNLLILIAKGVESSSMPGLLRHGEPPNERIHDQL